MQTLTPSRRAMTEPRKSPSRSAVGHPAATRTPRRPAGFGPVAEKDLMRAMEQYKQSSGRMFPTWSEVLEVLTSLGYRKPPTAVAAVRTASDGED